MSAAKAKAITDRYPTPYRLVEAYAHAGEGGEGGEMRRERLLAHLTAGGRKLGPALSNRVYQVMCKPQPLDQNAHGSGEKAVFMSGD